MYGCAHVCMFFCHDVGPPHTQTQKHTHRNTPETHTHARTYALTHAFTSSFTYKNTTRLDKSYIKTRLRPANIQRTYVYMYIYLHTKCTCSCAHLDNPKREEFDHCAHRVAHNRPSHKLDHRFLVLNLLLMCCIEVNMISLHVTY